MYIVEQLLTRYGSDKEVTSMLDKLGFLIVPIVNPDGYDYSWTNNRLWRKNRRRNSDGTHGVDLNRNWNARWGGEGSSRVPSSDTYCGTAPFSEPETKAMSELISTYKDSIVAALDIHSYSQLILRPYGWTKTAPPNDALLNSLGNDMRTIIKSVHGKSYTNEPSWQLYFTTGSAQDWFYEQADIPVSYTFELRDTGTYGFLLPPNQIIATGQEIFPAVSFMAQFLATNQSKLY